MTFFLEARVAAEEILLLLLLLLLLHHLFSVLGVERFHTTFSEILSVAWIDRK